MKKSLLSFVSFLLINILSAQTATFKSNLENAISESSGLIYLNHRIITHNDSGGKAALYEVDSINGQIVRTVYVGNTSNVDWEDICHDQSYIYIGDIGNNDGSRTNLRIYRIAIADYLNTPNDTVMADTISYSYANQTNFSPGNMATNFDAESLISIGDSLYIFTKNWKNSWSNVYAISNKPGTYQIDKKDSLDVKGFITGANYNTMDSVLTLVGYNIILAPFVVNVTGFGSGLFSQGTIVKKGLKLGSSASGQVESICHISGKQYYISSEAALGKSAALFNLDMSNNMSLSNVSKKEVMPYPNPVSNILQIGDAETVLSEIYNQSGMLVLKSDKHKVDISTLTEGTYILITHTIDGQVSTNKITVR